MGCIIAVILIGSIVSLLLIVALVLTVLFGFKDKDTPIESAIVLRLGDEIKSKEGKLVYKVNHIDKIKREVTLNNIVFFMD